MMSRASPVGFWRDVAPRLGFKLLDRHLEAGEDWDAALREGRSVMDNFIAKTGMRVDANTSVVEIGCGIGRLVFSLADRAEQVVGVDVSPWYIDQARRKNTYDNARFELIDGERLQLESIRECDVVFSYGVLIFVDIEGFGAYARDAYRLLRPGGQFIFELESMPKGRLSPAARFVRRALHAAGIAQWRDWPTDPRFERRVHGFEELVRALLGAGFVLERVADEPGHTFYTARKPAAGGARAGRTRGATTSPELVPG